MKKLNLTAILFFFGFILISAQSEVTKEKIKNLKGDVVKITIETNDDEIEITGEDASKLFEKMKSENHFMVKKMHNNLGKNVVFFEKGDDKDFKEIMINIEVDDKDGEKVVVIKKTVDGKETIEELKGDAAEEFLEEHEGGEHGMEFITEDGEEHIIMNIDGDDVKWISEDDEFDVDKKIKVEIKDDITKVTVTTKTDGKEKVDVYEGEEAQKYLEEMENEKNMKLHFSKDGKKKMKKIMIIEKEDRDEEEHEK